MKDLESNCFIFVSGAGTCLCNDRNFFVGTFAVSTFKACYTKCCVEQKNKRFTEWSFYSAFDDNISKVGVNTFEGFCGDKYFTRMKKYSEMLVLIPTNSFK